MGRGGFLRLETAIRSLVVSFRKEEGEYYFDQINNDEERAKDRDVSRAMGGGIGWLREQDTVFPLTHGREEVKVLQTYWSRYLRMYIL